VLLKTSILEKNLCAYSASPVLCGELNQLIKRAGWQLSKGLSPLSRSVKEFTQRHSISLRAMFQLW